LQLFWVNIIIVFLCILSALCESSASSAIL
jgi:hypothetical protein